MGWDAEKGTERRAKTKSGLDGSCQQKKDMDARSGWHSTCDKLRVHSLNAISTVPTLSARSPPSDMATEIIRMLPSATVE